MSSVVVVAVVVVVGEIKVFLIFLGLTTCDPSFFWRAFHIIWKSPEEHKIYNGKILIERPHNWIYCLLCVRFVFLCSFSQSIMFSILCSILKWKYGNIKMLASDLDWHVSRASFKYFTKIFGTTNFCMHISASVLFCVIWPPSTPTPLTKPTSPLPPYPLYHHLSI